MKVTLTLNNGVQLEFAADSITKRRVGNDLSGLEWTHADAGPRLFYVRLDEVAAIVTEDDNPGTDRKVGFVQ